MATIKTTRWLPMLRHCQGEAHTHLLVTKNGKPARQGRGLGFWFWHIGTAVTEIPVNDQSVAVTFKCRSQDYQEVSISAQVWYTVTEPETIATRFDFSINTATGNYNADPLTVIQGALSSAAQEAVWSHVAANTLEGLLQSKLSALSTAVSQALANLDFGVQVSRAVVTAVRPERSVEASLQAKTRERLQMEADAAGFERRAKATEQERAIQEAELANKLALAKQREQLIAQDAANQRSTAKSAAAVLQVQSKSQGEAEETRAGYALRVQSAKDDAIVEHERALMALRLDETSRLLQAHSTHPDGATAIALTRLPESLKGVRVLTVGEGGLQSALERIAPDPA